MNSLLKDAKSGDANSFAIIFAMSYEDLYYKASKYTRREYDIQDLLFKTYVTAYKNLYEVQDAGFLLEWLDKLFYAHLKIFLYKTFGTIDRKPFKVSSKNKMSIETAEQLLESVFMQVDSDPHSLPLESLLSYHKYRNNRFILQRVLLVVVILMLMVFPFFGSSPEMSITFVKSLSKYNQSHFYINITSVFPISTVIATMDDDSDVTVMLENVNIYEATAVKNGTMTVTATAINGKSTTKRIKVEGIDTTGPIVDDYELVDGNLVIRASDDNSGIDFEKTVTVKTSDASLHPPIEYNKSKGTLVMNYFGADDTSLVVYDMAGNSTTYTVR